MKKCLTLSLMLTIMIFILGGCGAKSSVEENDKNETEGVNEQIIEISEQQNNNDDIYFKVLNNEEKYINEKNSETLFSEYMEQYQDRDTAKVSYALFDLDNDNQNEMVILIESYDGFYLILNNENGKVYGFEDVYRGMSSIKTDGTYTGSGGAAITIVMKCKFEKNKRITEVLAESDINKFIVNNKNVSEDEFYSYLDKYNEKENVKFVDYKTYNFSKKTSESEENQINTQNTQFNEGTYTQTKPSTVGTEAEGYETTMTFSNGKVSFLESYWGEEKYGTYKVDGNILTVNYTSGVEVNSITGSENVSMNVTETFKIEGNQLIKQSTTSDSYYKAGDVVFEQE